METLYSMKEIAELTNTNKQKVKRFIKNNNIEPVQKLGQKLLFNEPVLNSYISTIKNKTGTHKPVQKTSEPVQINKNEPVHVPVINENNSETINFFIQQLKEKDNQIKEKDNQIKELNKALQNQQILTLNAQKEIKQQKIDYQKSKNSFWKNIFNISNKPK